MKLAIILILSLAVAGSALASTKSTTLTIRHQMRGCHSWSFANGPSRASLTIRVDRDAGLIIVNNDVMPHKLVETSGLSVVYTRVRAGGMTGLKGSFPPAMLARMGSATKITFARPGVYRFTTKAGEDYMAGIKTIGEDNVLHLTVRVD